MTIMGIDAGGTNVKLYCEIHNKVYSHSVPSGNDFSKEDFFECIKSFAKSLPRSVNAIGIAYSGIGSEHHIDKTNRNYLRNLDVNDFNGFDSKICFINDSNASAVAGALEYPDAKYLVGITNGTGIGSGICINGKLITGAHGYAGEINSNYMGFRENPMHAGFLCSGLALANTLLEHPEKETELIKNSSESFALLLTHVVNFLNPDVIYLSGGTFNYPGYFENVVKTLKEKGLDFMVEDLQIVLSTYGVYTGCLGAIQYAKQLFAEQT